MIYGFKNKRNLKIMKNVERFIKYMEIIFGEKKIRQIADNYKDCNLLDMEMCIVKKFDFTLMDNDISLNTCVNELHLKERKLRDKYRDFYVTDTIFKPLYVHTKYCSRNIQKCNAVTFFRNEEILNFKLNPCCIAYYLYVKDGKYKGFQKDLHNQNFLK